MNNIIDFIKVYRQHPITAFDELLNQAKHRYIYLIIIVFGFLLGFNNVINIMFLEPNNIDLGIITFSFIKSILITAIVIYVYSWIVMFLNGVLNGYSNQNDVLIVIVYSLMPLLIGMLILTLIKILLLFIPDMQNSYLLIFKLIYTVYLFFYIVSLIYLVIGNAIVSNFSIIKSTVSSSVLPIILTIYETIKVFK